MPAFDKELLVEILVEGMGRINYGSEMENDRKGIQKIKLGIQTVFDWEIYTLPFDNLDKARFGGAEIGKPSILKGEFFAEKGKDCFVDMKGFKKGFAVVNGFNIGRYWSKGPQRSLYLPAPLLKEKNPDYAFKRTVGVYFDCGNYTCVSIYSRQRQNERRRILVGIR